MASRIHVHKQNKNFEILFKDPIKNSTSRIKSVKKEVEALRICRDLDAEFYSEHPHLLPPGISLEKSSKRFRLYTRYGYISTHKTLMDALEQRQNIIDDLVEPKGFHKGKLKLFMNRE